jgi:hypothetical protein
MTAERHYGKLKVDVATMAVAVGPSAAALRFSVTYAMADYHGTKLLLPGWHAGTWGGARNCKFTDRDQATFDVCC